MKQICDMGIRIDFDNPIWTNPNPTATFAAQTISSLDFSGYDNFVVCFHPNAYNNVGINFYQYQIVRKADTYTYLAALTIQSNKGYAVYRLIRITDDTSVYFGSAAQQYPTTTAEAIMNDRVIPVAIYRMKQDLPN